jgi:SAM-dependent methyltransferase
MNMYDLIAQYYDLTHADLTDDIDYVLKLAAQTPGPILELGCGSGRLLFPLARAGHVITGLDNSSVMLSRARERLRRESNAVQRKVSLVKADMAAFELAGESLFGLILIPYNTFMHLEPRQRSGALRCISRYLRSDGRVFIDLINPVAVAQTPDDRTLTLEKSFIDPESGDRVLQMASNWLDQMAQVLHITWVYDAAPSAGGAVRRIVAEASYHYLYPHQLELLLSEVGFKLEALLGSYDGEPFAADSERLLLQAALS